MSTDSDQPIVQPDEKSVLKVRAWRLAGQGRTVRQIGDELGISPASVSRYVREVEGMQDEVDLLDRGEARAAQLVRLRRYIDMLEARVGQGLKFEQALPALMKVEDRLSKLHRMDDLPMSDEQGQPLLSDQQQRLAAAILAAQQHIDAEKAARNGNH